VPSPIKFVGDPFVDSGVAVLEFRIDKPCSQFDREDLKKQADELENLYSKRAWTGYLTVHFPNSCWCNPTMSDESKKKQRTTLLRSFDDPELAGTTCAYCRGPAQHLADRSAIPLLTGAGSMTAGAWGEPGLPVCSACQYAVQFYPLAALKVNGRPLFWWTPHHDWMYSLTVNFGRRVAQIVEGSPDQLPSLNWSSTLLLTAAEDVFRDLARLGSQLPLIDLLGCHVTNYGSGPDYEEIRLSRGLLDFLRSAQTYPAYRSIRDAAWEDLDARPRRRALGRDPKPDRGRRNYLFEELGRRLKSEARHQGDTVIRRFFRPKAGSEPGVFELVCIYARKVLEMTHEQVGAIKELAQQISTSHQAEKYLDRLFQRRGLTNYIRTLTEISDRMKRASESPLSMDTIVRAFDLVNEDDATGQDSAVVREMILIRLIEVLPHEKLVSLRALEAEENQEQ
jgi:CRISPR-associated protein Cst1